MITEDQIIALNPTVVDGVYIFYCDSEYPVVDGWRYCPYCNAPIVKAGNGRNTGIYGWAEYECGAEMAPGGPPGTCYIYGVSKMRAGCTINLSMPIQEDTI